MSEGPLGLPGFLADQATGIGRRLALGDSLDVPQQEETITETLLLGLARLHRHEVQITTYNRHEEARNGADWLWWLQGRTRWFGALVQAKRLTGSAPGGYDLGYSGRAASLQVDRLLAAARIGQVVAHHVLYNTAPGVASSSAEVRRFTPHCPLWRSRDDVGGATVLDAHVAKQLTLRVAKGGRRLIAQRVHVRLGEVAPHARPLPCLVVCGNACLPIWPMRLTLEEFARVIERESLPSLHWTELGFPDEEPDPDDLAAHMARASLLARLSPAEVEEFAAHRRPMPEDHPVIRYVRAAVRERPPVYVRRAEAGADSGSAPEPDEDRRPDPEALPPGVRRLVVVRRVDS